jgi:hypothetical protein
LLLESDGRPARERLTLIRVFEELRGLGYEGSYDAVRRYARAWSKERASETASAYAPLSFAPGEADQFEWSHEIVVMDGVTTTVKVAHVRLAMSRMMLARAYPRETQEMVFDAHEAGVRILQGRLRTRHLRRQEDGGRDDLHRQGSAIQSPLPPDALAPSCRACRLHAGVGLTRRAKSRTRSASCASASSRRACASRAMTS